jgi:tetratricopeptide (TPR) repeat protein
LFTENLGLSTRDGRMKVMHRPDMSRPDDDSYQACLRSGLEAYRCENFAAAAHYFTEALRLNPVDQAARINLANALWASGALDEAALIAQAALEPLIGAPAGGAESLLFEAWMINGAIRLARGDAPGAMAAYRAAVASRPAAASGHAGLAAGLLAQGDAAGAEAQADVALALDPACWHALGTKAASLAARADFAGAIAAYDAALAAQPGNAGFWLNRGAAKLDLDALEAAEQDLAMATQLDPLGFPAWVTRGYAACLAGRLDEAIACADRAISLEPEHPQPHWNRGIALLLKGDYPAGFAAYEWRKRHPLHGRAFTRLPAPIWQGEAVAGRSLLIRAEQGMGDTIMLARFIPELAARGLRITLACAPALHRLLQDLPATLIDLAAADETGGFDHAIDQMSLPLALGLTPSSIPGAAGYLRADPDLLAGALAWLAQHAAPARPRIGLVWAGNPGHDNDRRRSLPAGAFAPLLAAPGLSAPGLNAIALQFGAQRGAYPIPDAMTMVRDYADTAALIASLDAVVTVDTSVAHLAGALGVPCHIMLSSACDWRWGQAGADSPWYRSVRLHRQERLGDWSKPIESVMAALGCGGVASPSCVTVASGIQNIKRT